MLFNKARPKVEPSPIPLISFCAVLLAMFIAMVLHDGSTSSSFVLEGGGLDGWKPSGASSGVALYTKPMPHLTNALGVRGTSTIRLPLPDLMTAFFDIKLSTQWVQDLHSVEEKSLNKRTMEGQLTQRYRVAGGFVVKDREVRTDGDSDGSAASKTA